MSGKDTITMSQKEVKRLHVIHKLMDKELKQSGEGVILVRPEDVLLSRDLTGGKLIGVITGIRYRGDVYEATVEMSGFTIRVIHDKDRFMEHHWNLGEPVQVRFNRYKFFPAEEGHEIIRERLRSLGYIE